MVRLLIMAGMAAAVAGGCGTIKPKYARLGSVRWSPDQQHVLYFADSKPRNAIFFGMDGQCPTYCWYQEMHVRWCRADSPDKVNDVELKRAWLKSAWVDYTEPLYFSADGRLALKFDGKITVIELSTGKNAHMQQDGWIEGDWTVALPASLAEHREMAKIMPSGFWSAAISPDGKRTALLGPNGRLVIMDENIKATAAETRRRAAEDPNGRGVMVSF